MFRFSDVDGMKMYLIINVPDFQGNISSTVVQMKMLSLKDWSSCQHIWVIFSRFKNICYHAKLLTLNL